MEQIFTTWHSGIGVGEGLASLIGAGATGVRVLAKGCSKKVIENLRDVSSKGRHSRPFFVTMLDIPGNKPTVGGSHSGWHIRKAGVYRLHWDGVSPHGDGIPVLASQEFLQKTASGDSLHIGDGHLQLNVLSVDGQIVTVESLNDFHLTEFRSISSLRWQGNYKVTESALSILEGDLSSLGVSHVAISFASDSQLMEEIKKKVTSWENPPQVIAKIEDEAGIENLLDLAKTVDGLMIARGDLPRGVGLERFGQAQCKIIEQAKRAGKPITVATELLASLTSNVSPTISELSELMLWRTIGVKSFLLAEFVSLEDQVRALRWVVQTR